MEGKVHLINHVGILKIEFEKGIRFVPYPIHQHES